MICICYETDQWPVEHQQVVWQCKKCDQQPADITQVANIKMNDHKPVIHRQVVMKIHRSTENWPVTCQHHPGHHTDQWPVWCWQVWFEKYFFNWLEPKITTHLSYIGRLWWKSAAPPKTDQWPADIRQVTVPTSDLCDVGRFDPARKVWINLCDVGRFVGTFFTCAYMAGYPECKRRK